jgi:hypothetical protein
MGYDYRDITSKIPRLPCKKTCNLISWANIMEYGHFEYEKDLFRKEKDAIFNSFSWKITKPLRSISNLIRNALRHS